MFCGLMKTLVGHFESTSRKPEKWTEEIVDRGEVDENQRTMVREEMHEIEGTMEKEQRNGNQVITNFCGDKQETKKCFPSTTNSSL